jgi:hypothetical protein
MSSTAFHRQMSATALDVVVSPSRQLVSQKRKLSSAININDDINDQDDQLLDDDAATNHHKMLITRSTHRPCDKLSYSTIEVDDNDDEVLLGTTSMMKKSIPSPTDHNSQSVYCEVIAETTTMFDDGPIDWDDDLSYLFMFKEEDDAIC